VMAVVARPSSVLRIISAGAAHLTTGADRTILTSIQVQICGEISVHELGTTQGRRLSRLSHLSLAYL
jgi:hypothetical protein